MKTLHPLLVCLMTVILISCQKDEVKPDKATGSLHIDIGLSISVNEVNRTLKSTQNIADFKVTVYKSDGTEIITFESASDMPDTIKLIPGNYYVEAHSDNNLPAAFENPYYYGVSEVFTISSNMQQSVLVNCKLANTIVTVVYSENIMNSYINYMTTVSSELGSLVFSKNETRMGYFQTMPLDILVELTYLKPDGSEISKTLSGRIPDPLANRHYEILVNASLNDGMVSFQIILDETETQVEVIEITDNSDNQQSTEIEYGGLLITEIMHDPSALTDTYGEWFEIYNNSNQAVNLQNLVLGRDDANRHTITDSIVLLPGAYFVFNRNQLATEAVNSYIYGSSISLPNTGAVLAIYNKDNEAGPGDLIFSVNYGGTDFPNQPGTSISLNPNLINATDAVVGSSWCTSTSVYTTGDTGTPGVVNDLCQQD